MTARGVATRERILVAAADLMHTRGVAATTLDDVRAASGTSKSQLYHHFADKQVLIDAVITRQGEGLLEAQRRRLARLDSLRGLELWQQATVRSNAVRRGAYGCVLGSLASELADQDETWRATLQSYLEDWRRLLEAGLVRMKATGELVEASDPRALAIGLLAALQGGYLLAQAARDIEPMQVALDMALAHVRGFAASPRQ
jgi:TetR/AcrR family transcriptional regulator, transcriptional repressor for nem operon